MPEECPICKETEGCECDPIARELESTKRQLGICEGAIGGWKRFTAELESTIESLLNAAVEAETPAEAIQCIEQLKEQNLGMNDACVEYEKKIERLTSRGIEDMKDEIESLTEKLAASEDKSGVLLGILVQLVHALETEEDPIHSRRNAAWNAVRGAIDDESYYTDAVKRFTDLSSHLAAIEYQLETARERWHETEDKLAASEARVGELENSEELAWGMIANAWDWVKNPEWIQAAERWRDNWMASLPEAPGAFPEAPTPAAAEEMEK